MMTGGRMAGGAGDDEALSRLYQQVTDLQAARFSVEYDFEAGSERFQAWLRHDSPQNMAAVDAIRASRLRARRASPATLSVAPAAPMPGADVIALRILAGLAAAKDDFSPGRSDPDPDRALVVLYNDHYRSLVRLSALLTGSIPTAEEIVQDSFVALHDARRRPGSDSALSYLLQAVLTRTRATIRHRALTGPNATDSDQGTTGSGQNAMSSREYQAIVSALRMLPARQREIIVLRYCADLSEAQIAAAMGISRGAVKAHTARATASLRAISQDGHQ
jgi:RNA polymerase sigma factor (sigma-70 family)